MAMILTGIDELRVVLRDERRRQGLNQSEIPGVSRKVVSEFENGRSETRAESLLAIMDGLGCRLELTLPGQDHAVAPVEDLVEMDGAVDDIDLGAWRP